MLARNANLDISDSAKGRRCPVSVCLEEQAASGLWVETLKEMGQSLSYVIPRTVQIPTIIDLWQNWIAEAQADRVSAPSSFLQGLEHFAPNIRKQDQSFSVVLRERESN
jgi:hypothetical protein